MLPVCTVPVHDSRTKVTKFFLIRRLAARLPMTREAWIAILRSKVKVTKPHKVQTQNSP